MDKGLGSGAKHRRMFGRFLGDERGATAIEYAMIAAGVGAAVASTVWTLGESVQTTLYNKIANIF